MDVEKRSAAIVGAGLIGRAWAVVFARAGWQVRLFDAVATQLATARQLIAQSLADQEEAELLTDARGALARIVPCNTLSEALKDTEWVQENLPEEVSAQANRFCRVRPASAVQCNTGQQYVGDRRFAVHGRSCRTCTLSRCASGQSSTSGACR